jgi:hypothetical protein
MVGKFANHFLFTIRAKHCVRGVVSLKKFMSLHIFDARIFAYPPLVVG